MKILIYSAYFLPVVGGVQTSVELLARGFVQLGREEPQLPCDADGAGPDEVTVVTRSERGNMDDFALSYRVVRRPGFWQLVRLIREADILHLAGPCLLPQAIAWLIRKPAVIEHHGYQAICPNGMLFKQPSQVVCSGHFAKKEYGECVRCCSKTEGLLTGLRSVLLTFPRRWLCKRVDTNILISNHVGKRLNLPRTRTIYYGIPVISAIAAGRDGDPSPRVGLEIAYVGRLVVEKGPPVLLMAAKCLKEKGIPFRLSMIGGGPEQGRLEQLAESLGLSDLISFTGDLREAALEDAVKNVDVVVMPSICEETAGLAAIEQMMRGRVVIASDVGGLSEVVGNAGLKFPVGDFLSLCSRLQEIAEHPNQADRLGKLARERATGQFTWERMVREHRRLYADVLRSSRQQN